MERAVIPPGPDTLIQAPWIPRIECPPQVSLDIAHLYALDNPSAQPEDVMTTTLSNHGPSARPVNGFEAPLPRR